MVRLCPRCEERAVEGGAACRLCRQSGEALAKYWLRRGMPVRETGKRNRWLRAMWVEAEAA